MEVGDKVLSGPGDEGYGPLAILCQFYYDVRRALDVPAACFSPPPTVVSRFMLLVRREQPLVVPADEALFLKLVRAAFVMRRKTLVNNLVSGFSLSREEAATLLEEAGIRTQARAEELSIEAFCALSDRLAAKRSAKT